MKSSKKLGIEDLYLIQGILSKKEQKLLHELAQQCNGNIVEIGSWKGLSTVCLALGLKEGYKIYAIDPHEGSIEHERERIEDSYKDFVENIRKFGVENKVVPMVMTSKHAFKKWNKGKIALLWVDGNHEYEYVKYDVENWSKLLKKNGILAMHDFASPTDIDVTKVVFNIVARKMKFIKVVDKIILFMNTENNTHGINIIKLKAITFYYKFLYRNYNSILVNLIRKIKYYFKNEKSK